MINNTKEELSFNNFSEKIVNGIEVYSISNVAFDIYKKNAKNDKDISRDVLERKLTAMVLSTAVNNKLNGKNVYRFSGFAMIINERTKKIETISWLRDTHSAYISEQGTYKKLRQNYKLLGLNSKGNKMKNLS